MAAEQARRNFRRWRCARAVLLLLSALLRHTSAEVPNDQQRRGVQVDMNRHNDIFLRRKGTKSQGNGSSSSSISSSKQSKSKGSKSMKQNKTMGKGGSSLMSAKKGKGGSSKYHKVSVLDYVPHTSTGSTAVQGLIDNALGRQRTAGECSLNENGLFGDAEAAVMDGASLYTVDYIYQLSVAQGTTTRELNNIVIPAVDTAVASAILPFFFECGPDERRRRLQQSGTIDSFSALPVDIVVMNGCTLPFHCPSKCSLFFICFSSNVSKTSF